MEHDGHFQIGPLAGFVTRGGETPNIGALGAAMVVLAGAVDETVVAAGFSTTAGTVVLDLGAIAEYERVVGSEDVRNHSPASARHLSGKFFSKASCARANFGHENGVILLRT